MASKSDIYVSPTGQRTEIRDPAAVNNMVYGHGYRPLRDVEAEERAERERAEAEHGAERQTEQPVRQQVPDKPKQT